MFKSKSCLIYIYCKKKCCFSNIMPSEDQKNLINISTKCLFPLLVPFSVNLQEIWVRFLVRYINFLWVIPADPRGKWHPEQISQLAPTPSQPAQSVSTIYHVDTVSTNIGYMFNRDVTVSAHSNSLDCWIWLWSLYLPENINISQLQWCRVKFVKPPVSLNRHFWLFGP